MKGVFLSVIILLPLIILTTLKTKLHSLKKKISLIIIFRPKNEIRLTEFPFTQKHNWVSTTYEGHWRQTFDIKLETKKS